MKKLWDKIGWVFLTIAGSFIFGAGYAMFLGPNNLNVGGISGLSAILVQVINPDGQIPFLKVGTLTILIKVPIVIPCQWEVGKNDSIPSTPPHPGMNTLTVYRRETKTRV